MYVLQTIKQMTEEELDQIDKSMQMSAELNNKIMTQKLEIEEKKRKIAILEKTLVREILFLVKSEVYPLLYNKRLHSLGSTTRTYY